MIDKARTFVVALVAAIVVLWTLAGLVTLVYWSGLALWVCAAAALVGFVWVLRVYLRPSAAVVEAEVASSPATRRRDG